MDVQKIAAQVYKAGRKLDRGMVVADRFDVQYVVLEDDGTMAIKIRHGESGSAWSVVNDERSLAARLAAAIL